jgi:hypothetical protein
VAVISNVNNDMCCNADKNFSNPGKESDQEMSVLLGLTLTITYCPMLSDS